MLSDGVGRDGDACNLYCHEQCATCRETCRKVGSTILPKYAPSASQPYPRCVLRYLSSAVFSLTRCRLQSPRQRRPLRFLPQLWRGGVSPVRSNIRYCVSEPEGFLSTLGTVVLEAGIDVTPRS